MIYKDPRNLLQLKLNEALGLNEETIVTDLIKISLMKNASKDKEALSVTEVYNLLGIEKFTELITLLNGKELVLPTKEDFSDTIMTVLIYYYRDIEHLDWKEIKEKLGVDVNSIKYGIKASQFSSFIREIIDKRLK